MKWTPPDPSQMRRADSIAEYGRDNRVLGHASVQDISSMSDRLTNGPSPEAVPAHQRAAAVLRNAFRRNRSRPSLQLNTEFGDTLPLPAELGMGTAGGSASPANGETPLEDRNWQQWVLRRQDQGPAEMAADLSYAVELPTTRTGQ
ncbi:hypothetical protein LTS18_013534 [Coniosporium uncinatum]|uniref:Uncharacterized protein n=1 Tax=Coniosporium uncinatum TaxID=93489 RepID=A0ACC3DHZ8_9PEZI|nr:hypothetical protein LTS18_013534 [Coniosporium uncinatum]